MSGARNGFAQALANLQIVQQRNELFDQLFVDLSNANLNHDKIKKAIAKAKSFLITIKDHERADALEKLSQQHFLKWSDWVFLRKKDKNQILENFIAALAKERFKPTQTVTQEEKAKDAKEAKDTLKPHDFFGHTLEVLYVPTTQALVESAQHSETNNPVKIAIRHIAEQENIEKIKEALRAFNEYLENLTEDHIKTLSDPFYFPPEFKDFDTFTAFKAKLKADSEKILVMDKYHNILVNTIGLHILIKAFYKEYQQKNPGSSPQRKQVGDIPAHEKVLLTLLDRETKHEDTKPDETKALEKLKTLNQSWQKSINSESKKLGVISVVMGKSLPSQREVKANQFYLVRGKTEWEFYVPEETSFLGSLLKQGGYKLVKKELYEVPGLEDVLEDWIPDSRKDNGFVNLKNKIEIQELISESVFVAQPQDKVDHLEQFIMRRFFMLVRFYIDKNPPDRMEIFIAASLAKDFIEKRIKEGTQGKTFLNAEFFAEICSSLAKTFPELENPDHLARHIKQDQYTDVVTDYNSRVAAIEETEEAASEKELKKEQQEDRRFVARNTETLSAKKDLEAIREKISQFEQRFADVKKNKKKEAVLDAKELNNIYKLAKQQMENLIELKQNLLRAQLEIKQENGEKEGQNHLVYKFAEEQIAEINKTYAKFKKQLHTYKQAAHTETPKMILFLEAKIAAERKELKRQIEALPEIHRAIDREEKKLELAKKRMVLFHHPEVLEMLDKLSTQLNESKTNDDLHGALDYICKAYPDFTHFRIINELKKQLENIPKDTNFDKNQADQLIKKLRENYFSEQNKSLSLEEDEKKAQNGVTAAQTRFDQALASIAERQKLIETLKEDLSSLTGVAFQEEVLDMSPWKKARNPVQPPTDVISKDADSIIDFLREHLPNIHTLIASAKITSPKAQTPSKQFDFLSWLRSNALEVTILKVTPKQLMLALIFAMHQSTQKSRGFCLFGHQFGKVTDHNQIALVKNMYQHAARKWPQEFRGYQESFNTYKKANKSISIDGFMDHVAQGRIVSMQIDSPHQKRKRSMW